MLYLILGLFAVAAVMGLIIANAIISGKPSTPKAAVVAHGLFAATALGLLIYFALQNPDNYPNLSLILFIVAALGGAVLLIRDLQKKPGRLHWSLPTRFWQLPRLSSCCFLYCK